MSARVACGDPSVADQLRFDALPEDVRALVVRIYGFDPNEPPPEHFLSYSPGDLWKAYRAGWDAAAKVATPDALHDAFGAWHANALLDGDL